MSSNLATAGRPTTWRQRALPIGLMFLGFISLGLPDGLLGVAWPSIASERQVALGALGYLIAASSSGYLVASVLSGQLLARLGVGMLLACCCVATALSLLGFGLTASFWALLLFAVLLGAGGGAIDAGLNAYAAATSSPRVLSWLHASYGLGATSGPVIMTAVLSGGQSWQLGYLLVGCGQLGLAACFALARGRLATGDEAGAGLQEEGRHTSLGATARRPIVWLSVLTFLLYTGFEVAVGQWSYSLLTLGRGIDPTLAGRWVSLYWGGLTVGRIIAGVIANRVTPQLLLGLGAAGALVGALLVGLIASPAANAVGLVLVGVALAPIFPALIATTAERVGREHAANAIGFEVAAATVGAALVPWLAGQAASVAGPLALGPSIVVAGIAYVGVYALAHTLTPRAGSS